MSRSWRRHAGALGHGSCSGCRQCPRFHGTRAGLPRRISRTPCDAFACSRDRRCFLRPCGTEAPLVLRTCDSGSVARQDVRRPGRPEARAAPRVRSPHRKSAHPAAPADVPADREHAPVTASKLLSARRVGPDSRQAAAVPTLPRSPQRCLQSQEARYRLSQSLGAADCSAPNRRRCSRSRLPGCLVDLGVRGGDFDEILDADVEDVA